MGHRKSRENLHCKLLCAQHPLESVTHIQIDALLASALTPPSQHKQAPKRTVWGAGLPGFKYQLFLCVAQVTSSPRDSASPPVNGDDHHASLIGLWDHVVGRALKEVIQIMSLTQYLLVRCLLTAARGDD